MNEDMIAQFIATGGERPAKPKRPRAVNSTLPAKSEKQERLDKRWSDLRFAFLMCQLRSGNYHCQECGLIVDSPSMLDLDHIEKRNSKNYLADNAMLLCNYRSIHGENSCHSRKHGRPEWTPDALDDATGQGRR